MNPQALTEEEIKSAKRSYEEGATLKELSERFDVRQETISRWIKRYGAEVSRRVLTSEKEKSVIKLYQEGLSQCKIAKEFSISIGAVGNILERNNIKKRTHSESTRKYKLNQQVFEKITPESSYWIGFLLADGCIEEKRNGGDRISLKLKSEDKSHLEKFRKFLETDKPIFEKKGSRGHIRSIIRINSQKMTDDLRRFGIVPRKSLIADPKKINNRDFWRGMVDGDGHLSFNQRGYACLSLAGSKKVCEKFQEFVKSFSKTRASIHQQDRIYNFPVGGQYARKVAEELYKNAKVYLDRKYEIAKQFFN